MIKRAFGVIAALGALSLLAVAVNRDDANYKAGKDSGLKVGEMASAYEPRHVSGPDKNTETCPVCKYGKRPAVQAWINGDNMGNVVAMAKALDGAVKKHESSEFKAFVVVLTDKPEETEKYLAALSERLGLETVALTYLPKNSEAVDLYRINTDPEVKNTVFVYRNRKIESKFVNLKADEKGSKDLLAAIDAVTK